MENIYSLNSRLDKKNTIGSLVYQKENRLYHASIQKYIEHNQVHHYLKTSFEYCTIKNNDLPLTALFKYGRIYSESSFKATDYRLIMLSQLPGSYYPRIFRPLIRNRETISFGPSNKIEKLEEVILGLPDFIPHDFALQTMAVNQLGALKQILLSIFDTTYPASDNLKSYGQNIKNLLVLSCIEVETQLKGIFKANESVPKTNYTTKDYVKLKDILHLDKYQIRYPFYPQLKSFTPFKNWTTKNPTKSIKWYDSYNAIKHNGELEFSRATLENAILAFSAVAILLRAQYGNNLPYWEEKIGSFLEIEETIVWKIEEQILPPIHKGVWHSSKLNI